MDTAHWPQAIVVKPIEEIVTNTCPKPNNNSPDQRKGPSGIRPQKEQQVLNCPRCNSTNTKFCYYNNYSLTQPRYFCKTCRRYWTEGGSLRNIPVGGGSRKNKRSSSSSTTSSSTMDSSSNFSNLSTKKQILGEQVILQSSSLLNPNLKISNNNNIHEPQQDLNLAFHGFRPHQFLLENTNQISSSNSSSITNTTPTTAHNISALELLTGMTTSARGGLNSFMPIPILTTDPIMAASVYNTNCGFNHQIQEYMKPNSLHNFTTFNHPNDPHDPQPQPQPHHGVGSSTVVADGGAGLQSDMNDGHDDGDEQDGDGDQDQDHQSNNSGSRGILFPFEDLKQVSTTTTTTTTVNHGHENGSDQQNGVHAGYWTGMLGGGSW